MVLVNVGNLRGPQGSTGPQGPASGTDAELRAYVQQLVTALKAGTWQALYDLPDLPTPPAPPPADQG